MSKSNKNEKMNSNGQNLSLVRLNTIKKLASVWIFTIILLPALAGVFMLGNNVPRSSSTSDGNDTATFLDQLGNGTGAAMKTSGIPSKEILIDPLSNPNASADDDIFKYLTGNNNTLQEMWNAWLSKAAVHAFAISDDQEILAVGGGYLYDNEIHIYRYNHITQKYDKVWDTGDSIIQDDVMSLAFADTDNNHFLEIIAGSLDGHIYVFEQRHVYDPLFNTDNQFELVWKSPYYKKVWNVKTFDADLDFRKDIIATTWDGHVRVFEYLNHSGYPFSPQHWIQFQETWNSGDTLENDLPMTLATGYFDDDPLPDFAVGSRNGTYYVFENDGMTITIPDVDPYPICNDNHYRLQYKNNNTFWNPVFSMDSGDLDGDDLDEIVVTITGGTGAGVYVLDYVPFTMYMIGSTYGWKVSKLLRPLEPWETHGAYTLDHYVDRVISYYNPSWTTTTASLKIKGAPNSTYLPLVPMTFNYVGGYYYYSGVGGSYVFKPSLFKSMMSSSGELNSKILLNRDFSFHYSYPGLNLNLNVRDTFKVSAYVTVDFGNDQELTGDGDTSTSDAVIYFQPGTKPAKDKLSIFLGRDSSNASDMVQVPLSSMDPGMLTFFGGTEMSIDLDAALAAVEWPYARYMRLVSQVNTSVNAIEGFYLYRPINTALTARILPLNFDLRRTLEIYRGLPTALGTYLNSISWWPLSEERVKILIGTSEGNLLAYQYNESALGLYEQVWNSKVDERYQLENEGSPDNIWDIVPVKT
nr:hypothetical protein [Candidatus Sigynarchaeota archaeon]